MADEQNEKPEKVNNDRMAIIVAGIAIGITLISAPGLYTLTNIPIGLVLLMTLHAVDSRKDDNWFQSASFALAWALTFLLIAGLFLVNPYLTDNQGEFTPNVGHKITDQFTCKIKGQFTCIEAPAIVWIEDTFKEEGAAADVVSFGIVSIVAIIWFALRRLFFVVHKKPSKPQDEDKRTTSSKSSGQPVLTPVQPEKSQEPTLQAGSASTSLASEPGQRTVDRMILSVFTVVMALLVYVISTRGTKPT